MSAIGDTGRGESGDQPAPEDARDETVAARDDRNLGELVQELRIAGLGVQVLFGFLLSLPFTVRFARLSQPQRGLYVADVVLSAIATALLVAPVAYHRLVFRRNQKESLIRVANAMALGGLLAVALAISAAVLLVTSYVVPGLPTIVLCLSVVGIFAGLWLLVPLTQRERSGQAERR
jgi:hypothetical protein